MRDQELIEGAQAIAQELMLPNGRRLKIAKVIDRHLSWFEAARRRGLEWDDIIALLFAEGVMRPNGQRLTRGHLSSLVWRKLNSAPVEAAAAEATTVRRPAKTSDAARRRKVGVRTESLKDDEQRQADSVAPLRSTSKKPSGKTPIRRPLVDANGVRSNERAPSAASSLGGSKSAEEKADLLAFMHRAAALRRGSGAGDR